MRPVYFLSGLGMLGLGAMGAVLPVMPTTPFLLAAAWLFSRSSPRLEHWLLTHRVFGPPLRNWRREGAIASKVKCVAVASMVASYGVTLITVQPAPVLAGLLALILLTCAGFIVTRPAPRTHPVADA